jgi:hypothetical protein
MRGDGSRCRLTQAARKKKKAALVSRNRELELLLARMRESRNRGERVSAEHLALFTKFLREQTGGELTEADRKLAEVAEKHGGREEPAPPLRYWTGLMSSRLQVA